ncbi:hypothetical protein EPUS_04526 [Endocarpon pusillum Z07020]|uniref:Transcription factor Rba50 n=1 Tax=Endocarpon pusillum (strain Z07020 / HMAS-L-300199) TaxID=1263415 RepID=U1HIY3_ENDPU|nr:uncharacterized protein EPUS_04526 [Endocarpon pusillum Z07020]ERF68874.1 hypothetical protein EPUS_04526 [Endocarpon pusillum Z07020]
MSLRGQRFELDLGAEEFTPKPLSAHAAEVASDFSDFSLVGEIKERTPAAAPTAPKPRDSNTGFPAHKKRSTISAFKQQRGSQNVQSNRPGRLQNPPSDRAIAHHISKKYGYSIDAKERQEINEENKQRIAEMSPEDIEEARAELMSSLNPALIDRLLKRANIDEKCEEQNHCTLHTMDSESPPTSKSLEPETPNQPQPPDPPSQSDHHLVPPIHFPQPPIDPATFTPLDPSSPSFLEDLKTHYFPSTPHDPSSMAWLTDPSAEENQESPYNPDRDNYQISQLRFSFTGALIPPTESLNIPVDQGLHHHGLAPASAGYTVPELAILARSTMPSQRCVAYQILGRMMYRLGRGQFGVKGGELYEGLWGVVEKERVVEMMMAEANRSAGHASAKAYAVETLWLWRKGCGGERGLLKEAGTRAK